MRARRGEACPSACLPACPPPLRVAGVPTALGRVRPPLPPPVFIDTDIDGLRKGERAGALSMTVYH